MFVRGAAVRGDGVTEIVRGVAVRGDGVTDIFRGWSWWRGG